MDVEDVKFEAEGMLLSIRKSKTDQTGGGETLAIAYGDRKDLCAVRALRAWLVGANITSGPIFRRVRRHDQLTDDRLTDKSVALIVKKHSKAAGLDPRPAGRPQPALGRNDRSGPRRAQRARARSPDPPQGPQRAPRLRPARQRIRSAARVLTSRVRP